MIIFKALNVYVVAPHLDGVDQISKRTDAERQLADKVTFKRCLLDSASASLPLKVFQIWLARPVVAIYSPPSWTKQCTLYTKPMKPVVATLRKLGIQVVLYLDNMFIMTNSQNKTRDRSECRVKHMVSKTTKGDIGFTLDANAMTISLSS